MVHQAIVDGNNLLKAAHHVSGHLTNSKGEHTGSMLTMLDMLRTADRMAGPFDLILVAWDSSPTWRHEFFPDYKSNRLAKQSSDDPNEWYLQRMRIGSALAFHGVAQVQADFLEADDIAGSWYRADDRTIVYVSNDRDWLQLMKGDTHTIFRPRDKKILKESDIFEETECNSIEEYISMKAITGDPGDFIPGVPGIGPKKALKFLRGEMRAGMDHKKIQEWMDDKTSGYARSLTLYQLRDTPVRDTAIHTVDGQFNEAAVREFLQDCEAQAKLANFDKYITPFREMEARRVAPE